MVWGPHGGVFLPPKMTNVDCVLKLVLVGDSSTGKTTLIHRYVDGKYTPGYAPSIGVDFMYKNIDMDGRKVRLQIWDTAGQERYCSLSSTFCRGAEGILLVYDITNQKSFEGISRWLTSVNMHTSERVMKMLVANKCDQDGRRMVSTLEGQALAEALNLPFKETSAEKNMGVSEIFESLVRRIIQNSLHISHEHLTSSSNDQLSKTKGKCSC